MPIVNRANYTPYPSCQCWMHAADVKLDGNRVRICQECYERADASTALREGSWNARREAFADQAQAGQMKQKPFCMSQYCIYPNCETSKAIPTSCSVALNKLLELRGVL